MRSTRGGLTERLSLLAHGQHGDKSLLAALLVRQWLTHELTMGPLVRILTDGTGSLKAALPHPMLGKAQKVYFCLAGI